MGWNVICYYQEELHFGDRFWIKLTLFTNVLQLWSSICLIKIFTLFRVYSINYYEFYWGGWTGNTLKFSLHKTDVSFKSYAIILAFCTAKQELQSYLLQWCTDNIITEPDSSGRFWWAASSPGLTTGRKVWEVQLFPSVLALLLPQLQEMPKKVSEPKGDVGWRPHSELGLHCEPCN